MKKIYKLTFKKSYSLIECIVLLSLIILTCINLVGCESFKKALEGPKPEIVVDDFFNNLINKNYSKSYSHFCEENKETFALEEFIKTMQDFQEIIGYEIVSSNVGYKNAGIEVNLKTLSYNEEEITKIEIPLIKEDSDWKIVFFNIESEK